MLAMSGNTGVLSLPESWTQRCRVLVIGCGGSGSEVVDALARLHHVLRALGHPGLELTLQDGAAVRPANCGRQRFLPADVGKNKAEVLAARYGFLLGMNIRALPRHAIARHIAELGGSFDLVVTCVDRAAFRVRLFDYWRRRKSSVLWLDLGNSASIGQVVLGHLGKPATGERLPNVLDLYPAIREVDDRDEPSCSVEAALRSQRLGVNRFMADAAIFTIISPLFTHGQITSHGAFVDMAKPMVTPLRIDRAVWAAL